MARAALNGLRPRLWLTYVAVILFAVSPLFWVRIPALVDYPNHIARMWIITHQDLPAIAQNWQLHWRVLPNLAMDLVVPALAQVMPVELAGRIFVALTLALLVLGTAALRRALQGKAGFWPLLSVLFLYNSALFWGFLNYLFGLGCTLLAFAGWIASHRWPDGWRVIAFSGVAVVLFVFHLFAFALYGLLVVFYEFEGWRRTLPLRFGSLLRRAVAGLQFVPALVLWLATTPAVAAGKMDFGELGRKVYAWLAPIAFGLTPTLLPLATLGIGLILLVVAWRARVVSLVPLMRWPLAATAVLAAAMPFSLHGSYFADYRLPVALSFLLIAALQVKPIRRSHLILVVLPTAALFGIRILSTTELWIHAEKSFDEFRRAAAAIPEGARIMAVVRPMPAQWRWPDAGDSNLIAPSTQVFNHLALLAVIDRGVFEPTLFSTWTPVEPSALNGGHAPDDTVLRPEQLPAGAGAPCQLKYSCDWPDKFDYLVWIDYGRPPQPLPTRLVPAVTGSFFTIYRVTPG